MKTITGLLMLSALVVPSSPAAAQGHLQDQIERITEYALTIAADALGDLVDERAERADRQRGPDRNRDDRGQEYTDTFTRTVRLGRNGRLELDSLSGDVQVTGTSGDDVRITATKRVHAANESAARDALNAMQVQVTERAGVVTISAGPTRGRFNGADMDYVIAVPAATDLALKTASGDVTVKSVTGEVVVNSLSGDVVISESKPRAVNVELVSGDVSLEKVDSDRVQIKTLSGDITLAGRLAKNGRYELRTHSGDIQIIPEGNTGFELEASSFSGEVTSNFDLKRPAAAPSNFAPGGRGPRRSSEVRGTVNDGGAVLSLQSFSGDILITKR